MLTEYAIRDAAGELRAVHLRWDTPAGKRLAWRSPDGRSGLNGTRLVDLPLYGSEDVPTLAPDAWVIVTEGESDCDALRAAWVPAVATVTGASSSPTPEALASVASGRRFILWPDHDDAGRAHMAAVGAALYRAGAATVRVLAYVPTAAPLAKGAGARDLIGGVAPDLALIAVAWLTEDWTVPVDRPRAPQPAHRAHSGRPMDTGSVSAALVARGVLNARPGRNVRCPMHDDRHASLSVLRDDLRAICHAGACPWSGRGVIAADVLGVPS